MRSYSLRVLLIASVVFAFAAFWVIDCAASDRPLAKPALKGEMSLEEALSKRRSVRTFSDKPITVSEIAQLLWAAQGVTGDGGKRTAPSAGALYPLSVHVVVGKADGLSTGIYRYNAGKHSLIKVKGADHRGQLAKLAGGQKSVRNAPISFAIAVNYDRMDLYHARGRIYADMEQGHAVQNLLLQAVSLGLGAVPVGAMDTDRVSKLLDLPAEFTAEYIIPVGHPK